MRKFCFFLLMLGMTAVLGCSRYDYYPRGIHHEEQNHEFSSDSAVYTVKKDDTLYSIGKRFGVDYHILAKRNGIWPPYILYIGQELYIQDYAPNVTVRPKTHKPKVTPTVTVKHSAPAVKVKHPVARHAGISLVWPADGPIMSRFGLRKKRMHDGIDIGAREGADIVAAAPGKVVYADSRLSGYGNLIIIRHNSEMFSAYAHNKKNLVKRGDTVKQGQLIGYVGSTGRATGAHLHFEVRRGETAVDPMVYLPKR